MTVAAPAKLNKLLSEYSPGPDTVDALVLPFPYEGTVSYGEGTAEGPEIILETAEDQVEFYDTELRCSPCEKAGMFTLPCTPIKSSPEIGEKMKLSSFSSKRSCASRQKGHELRP